MTAPDKYTVVMALKEPFAPLLAFLALPSSAAAIMPKEIAEATPAGPVTEYVGTGPYRFVEWIPNRHIKLARWDKYASRTEPASGYAGRRDALVDEVIFYPVGNVATRIAGVQAGDYDIADLISADLYAQLKTDARVVPDVHEPGAWLVFFFNKKAGIMANVKLRQAVMAALSMQPILQVTVGNPDLFQLTPSIYPKGTPWYTEVGARWYNQGNARSGEKAGGRGGVQGRADPLADDPAVRLEPQVQPRWRRTSSARPASTWTCRSTSGPAWSSAAPSRPSGSCSPRPRVRPGPGAHRRVQPGLSRMVGDAREEPAACRS